MLDDVQRFIDEAARALAERVEGAVQDLMDKEQLTTADLKTRCTWLTYADGREVITLDGKPRIEIAPTTVSVPHNGDAK